MVGKLLERNQRIAVYAEQHRRVVRARARWAARGWIGWEPVEPAPVGVALRRRDERVTWVRGWDGEDVAAFRAQWLLTDSAQ